MNKKITKIIFLIFVINSYAQDIQLILKAQKAEFIEFEPIWIEAILENESTKDSIATKILRPENHYFKFELSNEKGDKFKYKGINLDQRSSNPKKVKLEKTNRKYLNLLDYYGENATPTFPAMYLKKGIYCLSATQKIDDGIIKSNEIKIIVKEAIGNEQKALTLYKKAYCEWMNYKDDDNAIKLYKQLIDTYPQSVYVESSYMKSFSCYQWGLHDYAKCIEVGEDLIKNYPMSPFSVRMVQYIIGPYKSLNRENEIRPKLMELKHKYGGINPSIEESVLEMLEKY